MRRSQLLYQPQLKKGTSTWYVEYYILDAQGKQKRIRRSRLYDGRELNSILNLQERETEGVKLAREIRMRIAPPALVKEETYFVEALQMAVELKRSNKERTNKSFREVARWMGEFFEKKGWQYLRCSQLKFEHVQAYFDDMIVRLKVRNSSHNTRKNNLRSLFGELVKRGYLNQNFAAQVKDRPKADPMRRPLSQDEFRVLLNFFREHDRAMYLASMLLGFLAIRPGELRDLRVGAIDLKRGMVIFPADFSKNNKVSNVTIPDQILPVLRSFGLEKYPAMHYLFGRALGRHNSGLLPGLERIGSNTLSNRFRSALKVLKREGKLSDTRGLQLYSLKDTLAIYLLDHGVDVESAMRHFRHSDLNMFQRYVKRLGMRNEKIKGLDIDFPI